MKIIKPSYQKENKGHYSPAILSNGMLYISGQLSVNPDTGEIPKGGIEAETKQCFNNIERILTAAGVSFQNIVQCRIYLSDIDNWGKVNELYGGFFGEHKPARCVVPVPSLHFGCLIEVEAIAEVEEK